MNTQQLHDKHRAILTQIYKRNIVESGNTDFDAYPTLLALVDEGGEESLGVCVLVDNGSPYDAAQKAVFELETPPRAVSFMAPAWKKDPTTGERVGESIMLVTESHLERIVTMFDLSREPFALTETVGAEIATRVNLLYQPTPTTEH